MGVIRYKTPDTAAEVDLAYDLDWRALDWAKKHCKSYITNSVARDDRDPYTLPKITYYFGKNSDATMFFLRWSDDNS